MRRELNNYLHLKHPFLPKFFGTEEQILASNDDPSYVVIEFINGRTLEFINQIGLKKEDKIRIIYELMTIMNYLHKNHFIYRDLKPDNVMIDKSNTAILIDFDRMVSYDDIKNSEDVLSDYSGYFMHAYAAPEVGTDINYSYACDIFSLGQMIYYIIEGKHPINVNLNNSFIEFPKLKDIFKKCTEKFQNNRPAIGELIKEFYQEFHLEYSLDDIQNIYIQDTATNNEIQSSSTLRNNNQNSIVQIINSEKDNHETGVLSDFINFINEFKSQKLKILNKYLNEQILNYDFLVVNNETTFDKNPNIFENLKISKLIVVHYINKKNIFVIGFEQTIIIVEISSISFIHQLFTQNSVLNICFFPNSKNYFDSYINLPYFEIEFNILLREEIAQFSRSLHLNQSTSSINKVWRDLQYCISGYLIQSSYLKLNKNRIQNFISEENDSFQKDFKENDEYIVLRLIQNSSISRTSLAYSINDRHLFVIKAPFYHGEQYLFAREISNYLEIKHPLIPKYYGRIKNGIAIEFISGNQLCDIERMHLSTNDKLTIIFQLMLIMEFLHRNQFIYRDLKPRKVFIDVNMTAVLISFNRMIHIDDDEEHTCDFESIFIAPEISFQCYLSYKCDIYSLGQIIKFIFPDKNRFSDDELHIEPIIKKCLCENPEERPSISELIFEFYSNYYSMINMEQMSDLMKETFDTLYDRNTAMILMNIQNIEKDSEISFNLGLIYHFSSIIPHDMDKTIYYYKHSSNLNNPKAQYHLGVIYYEDEYLKRDIDKSIYYFKLAANQNYASAQYNLGVIYYEGRFI